MKMNYKINRNIQANFIKPHGRDHVWCLFIQFNSLGKYSQIIRSLEIEKNEYAKIASMNEAKIKSYNRKDSPDRFKKEIDKHKKIVTQINLSLKNKGIDTKIKEIKKNNKKDLDIEKLEHIKNIKSWISKFAKKQITPLNKAIKDSERRKDKDYEKFFGKKYDGGLVTNFFLSSKGFKVLKENKFLKNLDYTNNEEHEPYKDCFNLGMNNELTRAKLNDVPTYAWEENYRQDIHAMILLADNSIKRLNNKTNIIATALAKNNLGKIIFSELGNTLKIDGIPREHFGYADGISNNDFLDASNTPDKRKSKLNIDDYGGSYLVFRKLEQNVKAFNEKVKALKERLEISEKFAGAQIIGRFKNGSPLSISNEKGKVFFTFGDDKAMSDKNGNKCPFHAHIRKANPKTEVLGSNIFRQGITYGMRKPDFSDEPQRGVGILFMCYQWHIKEFEKIQERCNNEKHLPNKTTKYGKDPLIGQFKEGEEKKMEHTWNKKWDRDGKEHKEPYVDFNNIKDEEDTNQATEVNKQLVTFKGGEYFYGPSIRYLLELGDFSKEEIEEILEVDPDEKRKENLESLKNIFNKLSEVASI